MHEPPGLSGEALDVYARSWAVAVAKALNRSGLAYLTPATAHGRWMVRVPIGALPTEQPHVSEGWDAMRYAAEAVTPKARP